MDLKQEELFELKQAELIIKDEYSCDREREPVYVFQCPVIPISTTPKVCHVETYLPGEQYAPEDYNDETETKSTTTKHCNKHRNQKSCECNQSNFNASYLNFLKSQFIQNLESHVPIHLIIKEFACSHCSYITTIEASFKQHLLVHSDGEPLRCEHCDYKTSNKCYLKRHILLHSDEKPHQCEHCNFKTSNKHYLKRHLLVHSKEKSLQCNHCDYKTSDKLSLRQHLLSHGEENPHQCPYCGYKTSIKRYMKDHLLVHSEEKPHQCKHCDYKTSIKRYLTYHLKRHLWEHSDEKLCSCKYCDYKASKLYMNQHMLVHHSDIRQHCEHCNYKTFNKDYFVLHLQSHEVNHIGEKHSSPGHTYNEDTKDFDIPLSDVQTVPIESIVFNSIDLVIKEESSDFNL